MGLKILCTSLVEEVARNRSMRNCFASSDTGCCNRCKKVDLSRFSLDGSFSPGKDGGVDVDHGYKGKGSLQHVLVEGHELPIAYTITSASGDERQQVGLLLDQIKEWLKPLGKNKVIPLLEADKGYDSEPLQTSIT
ncbi:MAG: transposase [Chlamydiales bacterium]|jgi:hypothetical protein|nr:transposase [Chlamydiales bacterium]